MRVHFKKMMSLLLAFAIAFLPAMGLVADRMAAAETVSTPTDLPGKSMAVTLKKSSFCYDGEVHLTKDLIKSVKVVEGETKTSYDAYTVSPAEIKDAGEHVLTIKDTAGVMDDVKVTVTITKNQLSLTAGTKTFTYDGKDHLAQAKLAVKAEGKLAEDVADDFEVVVYNGDKAVKEIVNAGTYTAKVVCSNKNFVVPADVEITVKPFEVAVKPVADQKLTYGEEFDPATAMFKVSKVSKTTQPVDYTEFAAATAASSDLASVVGTGKDLAVKTYEVKFAGLPAAYAGNYTCSEDVENAKIIVSYFATTKTVTLQGNLNKDTDEYYGEGDVVTLVAPKGFGIVVDVEAAPSAMKPVEKVDVLLDGKTATYSQDYRLVKTADGTVTDVMNVTFDQDLVNEAKLETTGAKSDAPSIKVTSKEALTEGVTVELVYTPHKDAKPIKDLDGTAAMAKGAAEKEVKFAYETTATFGKFTSKQYVPAGSTIKVSYTDVAGHVNWIEEVPVAAWADLSVEAITGFNATAAGIPVINDSDYAIVVKGEPNQIVAVTYNGEVEYIKLDAKGAAKYVPAYVEKTVNGVPQEQEAAVAYAHTDFAGAAKAAAIAFMYDDAADEPELTLPENMENRAPYLTLTLPEYGYIASVTATVGEDERVLYTADGVTDEYSDDAEQKVKISNTSNMGKEGTVEVVFVDLAGNIRTAEMPLVPSTYQITVDSLAPDRNDNDRIKEGDLIVGISGNPGESYIMRVSNFTSSGTFPQEGTATIVVPNGEIARNTTVSVYVAYVNVDGSNRSGNFIYDDHVAEPEVLTPVYENAYIIAGVAEVGSIVYISYPEYEDLGKTRANVDAYGFFVAELDMLAAGEHVRVTVTDLAGNVTTSTLTVGKEDEVGTVIAHPMGKLLVDADSEGRKWLNATNVTRKELQEGVTLPIIANNCFVIGEFTAKMDEDGKVTYHYEIDETKAELVNSYMTINTKGEFATFAAHELDAVQADQAFDVKANARQFWIYAEFEVVMNEDAMVESFQMEKIADSPLRRQYTMCQRVD